VPVARLKLRKEQRASARPFVVPLPPTAVEILKALKKEAGTSPWVLTSPSLDPTKPASLEQKALIRALSRLIASGKLALGSKVTVHDLRRTWRSLAGDLGVSAEVAEKSMGHTSALRAAGFSAAADVYGRAQMVDQRATAADLVAAALDRIRLGQGAAAVPIRERPVRV
jgi:integrase